MKPRNLALSLVAGAVLVTLCVWLRSPAPAVAPTLLSLRIGQSFQEVAKASTYPVVERSLVPAEDIGFFGTTDITEPAVTLCFNDPQHGFILPPTKFAAITYVENVVGVVTTSPMLDKLPFDEAIVILENLQNQFKAGGWEPWSVDGSEWFDFSPGGKKRLFQRMFESGYSQSAELRIPMTYGMTFRLKCTDGCWPGEKPPYLFLIDVSVGEDTVGQEPEDPHIWDESFPGNRPSTAPARFTCPAGSSP